VSWKDEAAGTEYTVSDFTLRPGGWLPGYQSNSSLLDDNSRIGTEDGGEVFSAPET